MLILLIRFASLVPKQPQIFATTLRSFMVVIHSCVEIGNTYVYIHHRSRVPSQDTFCRFYHLTSALQFENATVDHGYSRIEIGPFGSVGTHMDQNKAHTHRNTFPNAPIPPHDYLRTLTWQSLTGGHPRIDSTHTDQRNRSLICRVGYRCVLRLLVNIAFLSVAFNMIQKC